MKRDDDAIDVAVDVHEAGAHLGCTDLLMCLAECWVGLERMCGLIVRLASCPCLDMTQSELESWGVRSQGQQEMAHARIEAG